MEAEREEFTKTYWPKIDSFCKRKGLQFVPVDMRWGITEELSKNNQTINVCLKEIDRSDMFVGFFGQVSLLLKLFDKQVTLVSFKFHFNFDSFTL